MGVTIMKLVLLAMSLTMKYEGYSDKIYLCPAGEPSIWYGRNLKFYPLTEDEKSKYIEKGEDAHEHAKEWLKGNLLSIIKVLKDKEYFVNQLPARQAAMVDMVYNMGMSSFNEFKNFKQAMIDKDFEKASKELATGSGEGGKSKWLIQTKNRAEEIIEIIRTGKI